MATVIAPRSPKVESTAFLLCDIQEKFAPAIAYWPSVIRTAQSLLAVARTFKIPVYATEQNPTRLGKTVPELDLTGVEVFTKSTFSMLVPQIKANLEKAKIKSVVLFGVEMHVCILQTAIELLQYGYDVYVPADGCSSRFNFERMVAFDTLRQYGAVITTKEAIMLQLLGNFERPEFKALLPIAKQPELETGLTKGRIETATESKL